ncbi:MAG: multiheme c-type cytochrome [Alcanivoracaceae bacterium]|jgi:hypothetical protein|nr:multiheme c-type cytochrome [Alcanivoracaceae bacterium]
MNRVWLTGLLVLSGALWAADKHMGVATCASSVCHGSSSERSEANILHSEYVIWGQRDPHAGAYKTLLNQQSQRIAKNLGIGPAHEAKACLVCHSDYVPQAERGPRFQLSDGVGCESCHGGSERWLSSHTERGVTHEDNLQRGLTLLQDADVRAEMCASCHVGDSERMADHDIMGAGHPRLQFELATYSRLWPSHYRDNEAYRERKHSPDSLELWTAGQLRSARNILQGLGSKRFMATPMWPELAFFDCHSCHAPMDSEKWQPRAAGKLPPGAVRLNDSSLLMVGWLLDASDSAAARQWRAGIASLHEASQQGSAAVKKASGRLLDQLDDFSSRLKEQPQLRPQPAVLFKRISEDALRATFNDYMTAEQVLMVLALLAEKQDADPAMLDGLYKSMADQHHFRSVEFLRTLQQYQKNLAK